MFLVCEIFLAKLFFFRSLFSFLRTHYMLHPPKRSSSRTTVNTSIDVLLLKIILCRIATILHAL